MKWVVVVIGGLCLGAVVGLVAVFALESQSARVVENLAELDTAVELVESNLESEDVEISVVAVGDVMLGRSVNTRMLKYGSVDWPFDEVREVLVGADITLGNLENPLIEGCPARDDGMIFCGRAEAVEGLVQAGFDGMSLANNHSFNYGEDGVRETERILDSAGIEVAGNGLVGEFEVEGVRIGVLAYDDVSQWMNEVEVMEEISGIAEEFEVVMVMMHWGAEYVDEPNERQVELGRAMVDAGADVVLGAHPHWTQPVEEYEGGLIFYSLGNFVFDQMWSEETRLGEIAFLKLITNNSKLKTIEYELVPVRIYDYGQPRLLDSSY